MTRKASLWLVAVAVVFYAAQLGAHHSISAEFDTNKRKQLVHDIQRYEGGKMFFPRIGGARGRHVHPACVGGVRLLSGAVPGGG